MLRKILYIARKSKDYLFGLSKKKSCKKDSTKDCPLWYSFDRNGAFISGGHIGCCKIQDQIKAADRLHKLVKEKNLKIEI